LEKHLILEDSVVLDVSITANIFYGLSCFFQVFLILV